MSEQNASSKRTCLLKVAKGIVEPKHQKQWPQICRVLRRSLFTTHLVEFSGISVVIKLMDDTNLQRFKSELHRRPACSVLQIDIRNLYHIHTEK